MIERGEIDHVIGIDRGERNLITVSLLDMSGNVIEAKSLNVIRDIDYQKLIDEAHKKMIDQSRSWQQLDGIKAIKNGYMSQVVKQVCQMAVDNNAVIVMEDLNDKFKEKRSSVGVEVYRAFETTLE